MDKSLNISDRKNCQHQLRLIKARDSEQPYGFARDSSEKESRGGRQRRSQQASGFTRLLLERSIRLD